MASNWVDITTNFQYSPDLFNIRNYIKKYNYHLKLKQLLIFLSLSLSSTTLQKGY